MKNISKRLCFSHIFAFIIVALIMTVNVNAATITLDANSDKQIVVNEDTTIDLNGKTLKVTGTHAIIVNKGATLTIKGDGQVTADKAAIFNKGGVVNILGGNYLSNSWYTIKNLGVMTIKDGTIGGIEQKNNSSLVANGYYGKISNDEQAYPTEDPDIVLTIDGGTFNHFTNTSTIKGDDWSNTVINNGVFNSKQGFLIQVTGVVEVNGGQFNGYDSIATLYGFKEPQYLGIFIINGGTFSAKYIARADYDGKLTVNGGDFTNVTEGVINPLKMCKGVMCSYTAAITGGTFATDVASYVAEGYVQGKVNNQYVVAKKEVKVDTPTIDTSKTVVEVKEVTIGVKEDETVTQTLQEALKADTKLAEQIKDINAVVEVSVANQEEKVAPKEAVASINKLVEETTKKAANKTEMKVASFFDITLNVKNNITGEQLGTLTELGKKIAFNVALPEDVTNVADGYTRTYYIVRYHDGEAEILNTTLSGNVLTFETDKFSTYAIAYTDTLTSTNQAAETETVVNPSTGDNIIAYAAAGIISMMGISSIAVYAYRSQHN